MKKNDRISAYVQQLGADPALALDARYQGYFTCFNGQQYYEAHDVLVRLGDLNDDEATARGISEEWLRGLERERRAVWACTIKG